ncbi:hypothetical protein ABK905_12555 [Acerihabitans sp. KWT182]|uniref:Ankyrin repeat domain-containing protein n=1 Tax=Acerihabitans sp. KWT182 TaxID=3157919 RepID=A0AAU7QFK5_9GAMM
MNIQGPCGNGDQETLYPRAIFSLVIKGDISSIKTLIEIDEGIHLYALKYGTSQMVNELLAHPKVDVNVLDKHGDLALHRIF